MAKRVLKIVEYQGDDPMPFYLYCAWRAGHLGLSLAYTERVAKADRAELGAYWHDLAALVRHDCMLIVSDRLKAYGITAETSDKKVQ